MGKSRKMLKKLVLPPKSDACKGCPWFGDGTGFVPDEVNDAARILFIGARPGETEEIQGKAHCGGNAKMIEGNIAKYGLTRQDASWINVLRCRYNHSSNKPSSFADAAAYCRLTYPYPDPQSYKVVVPLDDESLKLVTGHEEMEKWRGSPIRQNGGFADGRIILPTYHPSAVFQKPRLRSASKSDFRRLADIARYGIGAFEYRDHFYCNESPENFISRFHEHTQRQDALLTLDIETSKHKAFDAQMGIFGFAWAKDGAANVDWDLLTGEQVEQLQRLVKGAKCSFITATPFDYSVLTKYNFRFRWKDCHDLTLLHSRFDIELPHTVEFIASTWTYRQYWKWMNESDPFLYNCLDNAAEWEAFTKLHRHCQAYDIDVLVCYNNDRRSIRTAVKLHLTGMPLDKDIFAEEKKVYSVLRDKIESELVAEFEKDKPALGEPPRCKKHKRYTGKTILKLRKDEKVLCDSCLLLYEFAKASEPLNLRARTQVMAILKSEGKDIPLGKKTHAESLDKAAIEKLAVKYADPRMVRLLEFKSMDTVLTRYFREARTSSDGRVHANFNMHGAMHRWHSTEPNQQQVKRPEVINGEVHGPRCAYVCPPGKIFLGFDADGLHYRIAGCLSGDSFINATLSKYDEEKAQEFKPHIVNGAALFHVSTAQVIEWMHAKAPQYIFCKNFIYCLENGGTAPALHLAAVTAGLKLDLPEVSQLMNNWLNAAHRYRDWREELVGEAERTGMITLFDGRRRRYYGLRWRDGKWHAGSEEIKEIYNHPLLGTEVSYVNPRVEKVVDFVEENPQWELVLYDHDGFMLMGPDSEANEIVNWCMPMLQEPMTIGPGKVLRVPWTPTIGRTWAEMKEFARES